MTTNTTEDAGPAPGYKSHPQHFVDIEPAGERFTATCNGVVIADSSSAVTVRENGCSPLTYFPAQDVRLDLMSKTQHQTYCPFKGHASYWSFESDGEIFENVAWGYETPFDEALGLKDHIAFYADRVTVET